MQHAQGDLGILEHALNQGIVWIGLFHFQDEIHVLYHGSQPGLRLRRAHRQYEHEYSAWQCHQPGLLFFGIVRYGCAPS